ncbi:MAG: DHH family phosphoesterase [Methanosarcinales archaeon]|jgi:RecJ-like exonuclease|nr:DHH family phosphoesterase [Methanosarcinales archaeon]
MSEKCSNCYGQGYNITETGPCPKCSGVVGAGKPKTINLMDLSEKNLDSFVSGVCDTCGGTGIYEKKEKCEECRGKGETYSCTRCGKTIPYLNNNGEEVCNACLSSGCVHKLDNSCDYNDLASGKLYIGCIDGVVENLGAFVKLNDGIKGLLHEKNFDSACVSITKGDEIIVQIKNINRTGRDVKLDLVPKRLGKYELIEVEKEFPLTSIGNMTQKDNGKTVKFVGEVLQVKQTGGPTIFTVSDETGQVPCAGFSTAGQRSYPEIDAGMAVSAVGEINIRDGAIQIELLSLKKLPEGEAAELIQKIEEAIDKRAEAHDIPFLVESEVLEKLKPAMLQAAKEIRKAILRSRPIVLRHHADADGITSAIAIEKAILPLIREVGGPDAEYRAYRRSPSKAPFYELMDVVKDVSYAVEDEIRFGQPMPLIVMVDNGSTEEDVPAYKHTQVYGMDIVVIDHHHPDAVADDYLIAHVNPYKVGGDFGLTAGMLCVETARMIRPEISDEIVHLAAIAGVGDRSDSPECAQYLEMVSDRYPLEHLKKIALSLDYEQYWLKFGSGVGIIDDILDLRDHDTHLRLISMLTEQAAGMISEQLEVCLPNVKMTELESGAILNTIDVEKFAHKFTFPPPGKTSGEIHDIMCNQKYPDKPVITLGLGPDFAVIRSKKVLMNIPQIVRELREELIGTGINGGGHLVVGSIKFVEGAADVVIPKLIEKLAKADVEK